MQIRTNQKGFEAFKSKFESLESNSEQSNEIQTTWKGYKGFEYKFEPFEKDSKNLNPNSNYSKEIRSIRIQVRTIQKWFEAFECKFVAFKCKFEPLERDSKHLNAI